MWLVPLRARTRFWVGRPVASLTRPFPSPVQTLFVGRDPPEWWLLERQPGFEPGSSAWEAEALPHELLPLLVWLLITGWLTLGGDIRASALHSSCTIQMFCCPPVPQCALSEVLLSKCPFLGV